MLALERQGLTVVRNASYSGDGGTDGQVIIDDECWLIQAKRYSRAITPTHIRDFDQLLEQRTCCGFFIHTGRTGHMSRAVCSTSPRLLSSVVSACWICLPADIAGCQVVHIFRGNLYDIFFTEDLVSHPWPFIFVWPALLTGGVMLVMAFLSHQGASHRGWIITHMRLPAGATRRKGALWCGAVSMPLRTMPYSLLHR